MAGLADTKGHLTKTYQYTVTGELAFGSATYENEYTYNGESYNPNIHSQYLRARYYSVVTASFLTGDSYLGNIREPLTLNRYNYCVSSYLNYVDPSGNRLIPQDARDEIQKLVGRDYYIPRIQGVRDKILDALGLNGFHLEMPPSMREGKTIPPMWTPTYGVERDGNGAWMDGGIGAFLNNIKCEHDAEYYLQIAAERAEENRRNEACESTNTVYAIVGTAKSPLTEDEKKSNARYIYHYLIQEGWTVEAISGLFGNIERESGFNPGVWYTLNDANKAYGLVQWSPVRKKLFYWMETEKGYNMLSENEEVGYSGVYVVNDFATENPQLLMDLQLEFFIWSNLATTQSDHREWIATTDYGSPYKMSYAEYIASEYDVGDLALVFHASYERSGDSEAIKQERVQNAKDWYDYLLSIHN